MVTKKISGFLYFCFYSSYLGQYLLMYPLLWAPEAFWATKTHLKSRHEKNVKNSTSKKTQYIPIPIKTNSDIWWGTSTLLFFDVNGMRGGCQRDIQQKTALFCMVEHLPNIDMSYPWIYTFIGIDTYTNIQNHK